jgi:hypothetical protein
MRTIFTGTGAGRAVLAAALFSALGAAACGGGGGNTGGGGSGTTSSTTSGDTTSSTSTGSNQIDCTGQPADLSLTGTWAAHGQLSVKLQGVPGGAIQICPADQVGAAEMILLLTVKQNATDATKLDEVKATLCSISLPTVTALVGTCDPNSPALVSTQIIAPQAFIDALPKVAAAVVSGTLSGAAPGASLTFDELDVTVGSTASGTALPKWDTSSNPCAAAGIGNKTTCETTCVSDCASLADQDGDGYPAVTAQVCGFTPDDTKQGVKCNADSPSTPGSTLQGKAFLDIEVTPTFTGTAKSSCEVTGTVDSKIDYNVVGADVYLAGAPIPVTSAIKSLPIFQIDPQASKFRMVRIDGQYGAPDWKVDPTTASAACATLNMRVNEL